MSNQNFSSNDLVNLQKMFFIFNAVKSGWTVKMVEDNTFEFKKNKNNQEMNLDNYLKYFVSNNLNIDNIFKKNNDEKYNNQKNTKYK